jgi:hypothetical protein
VHFIEWVLGDQQWTELLEILGEHRDTALVKELDAMGLLEPR